MSCQPKGVGYDSEHFCGKNLLGGERQSQEGTPGPPEQLSGKPEGKQATRLSTRNLQTVSLMAAAPCSCFAGTDQAVHLRQRVGTFAPRMLCRALGRGGQKGKNVAAFIRSSPLLDKRWTPCANDSGALKLRGMCKALSRDQAESMLQGEV